MAPGGADARPVDGGVTLLSRCTVALLTIIVLAEVELLELHGPDGQVVFVNEYQISSLREPTSRDLNRFFPRATHCVVVTTNGKFIAAMETCEAIRELIQRHTGSNSQ